MAEDMEGQSGGLLPLEGVDRIRRTMYEGQEYWSVVDVIGFLTGAASPSKYWNTMRSRMLSEGARETLAQIVEVPMRSQDGRLRRTDAMTRQTLLRLVQSIPSPKAEPFKLFLAEAGDERLTQMERESDTVEALREAPPGAGKPLQAEACKKGIADGGFEEAQAPSASGGETARLGG